MIGDGKKDNVLIYADPLLPSSETFIQAQGEALKNFTPYYIGPKRLGRSGLKMPDNRTLAINGIRGQIGRIREAPFRYFGYAPVYFRRLRKLRPVLLHAHFGPGGLRALGLAEWLGIPLITTFHGFDATITDSYALKGKFGHRDYVRRRGILKQKGRLFLAVSRFVKDKILAQGFPEGRVIVHYTGVDTEFFCPDPAVKRDPIVLFTGNLIPLKGCEYLVRAVETVQTRIPDIELVVIGEGPERARLEALARGKLKRFQFLGRQPREVVKEWMNRAKVFSVPSVRVESGAEEGFGMVFVEAQAMGCPVASFSVGGIPEAVAHGETGLLAREKDSEALARNIEALLRNGEKWQRMSEAGWRRARSFFDLAKQTLLLEDFYRHVLGSERCSVPV